jgi:predicted HicB family RNase H-like nuclease
MKKLTLRVDDNLHQELVEWAKRENRSLHAQLLTIVQQALEAEKSAARSESL